MSLGSVFKVAAMEEPNYEELLLDAKSLAVVSRGAISGALSIVSNICDFIKDVKKCDDIDDLSKIRIINCIGAICSFLTRAIENKYGIPATYGKGNEDEWMRKAKKELYKTVIECFKEDRENLGKPHHDYDIKIVTKIKMELLALSQDIRRLKRNISLYKAVRNKATADVTAYATIDESRSEEEKKILRRNRQNTLTAVQSMLRPHNISTVRNVKRLRTKNENMENAIENTKEQIEHYSSMLMSLVKQYPIGGEDEKGDAKHKTLQRAIVFDEFFKLARANEVIMKMLKQGESAEEYAHMPSADDHGGEEGYPDAGDETITQDTMGPETIVSEESGEPLTTVIEDTCAVSPVKSEELPEEEAVEEECTMADDEVASFTAAEERDAAKLDDVPPRKETKAIDVDQSAYTHETLEELEPSVISHYNETIINELITDPSNVSVEATETEAPSYIPLEKEHKNSLHSREDAELPDTVDISTMTESPDNLEDEKPADEIITESKGITEELIQEDPMEVSTSRNLADEIEEGNAKAKGEITAGENDYVASEANDDVRAEAKDSEAVTKAVDTLKEVIELEEIEKMGISSKLVSRHGIDSSKQTTVVSTADIEVGTQALPSVLNADANAGSNNNSFPSIDVAEVTPLNAENDFETLEGEDTSEEQHNEESTKDEGALEEINNGLQEPRTAIEPADDVEILESATDNMEPEPLEGEGCIVPNVANSTEEHANVIDRVNDDIPKEREYTEINEIARTADEIGESALTEVEGQDDGSKTLESSPRVDTSENSEKITIEKTIAEEPTVEASPDAALGEHILRTKSIPEMLLQVSPSTYDDKRYGMYVPADGRAPTKYTESNMWKELTSIKEEVVGLKKVVSHIETYLSSYNHFTTRKTRKQDLTENIATADTTMEMSFLNTEAVAQVMEELERSPNADIPESNTGGEETAALKRLDALTEKVMNGISLIEIEHSKDHTGTITPAEAEERVLYTTLEDPNIFNQVQDSDFIQEQCVVKPLADNTIITVATGGDEGTIITEPVEGNESAADNLEREKTNFIENGDAFLIAQGTIEDEEGITPTGEFLEYARPEGALMEKTGDGNIVNKEIMLLEEDAVDNREGEMESPVGAIIDKRDEKERLESDEAISGRNLMEPLERVENGLNNEEICNDRELLEDVVDSPLEEATRERMEDSNNLYKEDESPIEREEGTTAVIPPVDNADADALDASSVGNSQYTLATETREEVVVDNLSIPAMIELRNDIESELLQNLLAEASLGTNMATNEEDNHAYSPFKGSEVEVDLNDISYDILKELEEIYTMIQSDDIYKGFEGDPLGGHDLTGDDDTEDIHRLIASSTGGKETLKRQRTDEGLETSTKESPANVEDKERDMHDTLEQDTMIFNDAGTGRAPDQVDADKGGLYFGIFSRFPSAVPVMPEDVMAKHYSEFQMFKAFIQLREKGNSSQKENIDKDEDLRNIKISSYLSGISEPQTPFLFNN